ASARCKATPACASWTHTALRCRPTGRPSITSKAERSVDRPTDPAAPPALPPRPSAPQRPSVRFLLSHPAHLVALGFGAGLSPKAPGTVGTLWAWLSFLVLDRWLTD